MLIFNCTAAAQNFLTQVVQGEKISPVMPAPDPATEAEWLRAQTGQTACWTARWQLHQISLANKKVLIAVEHDSRFCLLFSGLLKGNAAMFERQFRTLLAAQLHALAERDGITPLLPVSELTDKLQQLCPAALFIKRGDRSVQAHINQLSQIVQDEDPAVLEPALLFALTMELNDGLLSTPASRAGKPSHEGYFRPAMAFLQQYGARLLGLSASQLAQAEANAKARRQQKTAAFHQLVHTAWTQLHGEHHVEPWSKSPMTTELSQHHTLAKQQLARLQNTDKLIAAGWSDEDMLFVLEYLLQNPADDGVLSLSALDGLLTSVCTGPDECSAQEWLPLIWSEDFEPVWANPQDKPRFMRLIFALQQYNARLLWEQPASFVVLSQTGRTYPGCGELPDVSDWCRGYLSITHLQLAAWSMLSDELRGVLGLFGLLASGVKGDTGLLDKVPLADYQQMVSKVADCAVALHLFWLQPDSPQSASLIQSDEPYRAGVKTGRNEPCPCGSGKKYKKCCGA